MDDKEVLLKWVHEAEAARMERTIKRLWILCIIIFVAFVLSNALWIRYENQFEDVVTETTATVTQDESAESGDASVNAVISGGDLDYGKSETDSNCQDNN